MPWEQIFNYSYLIIILVILVMIWVNSQRREARDHRIELMLIETFKQNGQNTRDLYDLALRAVRTTEDLIKLLQKDKE